MPIRSDPSSSQMNSTQTYLSKYIIPITTCMREARFDLGACIMPSTQEAEADPPGTPGRRPEEEEEEVPGSPSSTYSFVDDGNPFRHGNYLDDT